jgi:hypothetical protein
MKNIGLVSLRRCSNLECPNRFGEGPFVLLTANELTRHRGLTLMLCEPCAIGLMDSIPLQKGDES